MNKFGYLAPTYRLVEEIVRMKRSNSNLRFKFKCIYACYQDSLRIEDAYKQKLFLEKKRSSQLDHENAVFSSRDLSARQIASHAIGTAKEEFIEKTNGLLRDQHDRLQDQFDQSLGTNSIKLEKLQDQLDQALEINSIKIEKMTEDYLEQSIAVERLTCQLAAARAVNLEMSNGSNKKPLTTREDSQGPTRTHAPTSVEPHHEALRTLATNAPRKEA